MGTPLYRHTHIHTHTERYTRTHIQKDICTSTCMDTQTHIPYMYAHIDTHTDIHAHAHRKQTHHKHSPIHTDTHTHAGTHMHSLSRHTHTEAYPRSLRPQPACPLPWPSMSLVLPFRVGAPGPALAQEADRHQLWAICSLVGTGVALGLSSTQPCGLHGWAGWEDLCWDLRDSWRARGPGNTAVWSWDLHRSGSWLDGLAERSAQGQGGPCTGLRGVL